VAKAILVAQFLRARAWWRLDSAGDNALHVARSVVSLLDTAAYLRDVPDDHPDIRTLEAVGCFQGGGAFDPGPEGAVIIRDWQLADRQSGGPEDLLSALAEAADRTRPGGPVSQPGAPVGQPAATSVPPQRWPAQLPPVPHLGT
jgi:hypothetical protein